MLKSSCLLSNLNFDCHRFNLFNPHLLFILFYSKTINTIDFFYTITTNVYILDKLKKVFEQKSINNK